VVDRTSLKTLRFSPPRRAAEAYRFNLDIGRLLLSNHLKHQLAVDNFGRIPLARDNASLARILLFLLSNYDEYQC